MKKLLLLASEKIGDQKYYLYAMELVYQKVIRIIKEDDVERLSSNWKIGSITSVEKMSRYTLDKSLYVTSNESLEGEYTEFTKLMLNKASYPDRILSMVSGTSQAILRLRQVKIVNQAKTLEFVPWGTDKKKTAQVMDPWWVRYWENNYSKEKIDYYEKLLSKNKKKTFAFVEAKDSDLTIKKLIVL